MLGKGRMAALGFQHVLAMYAGAVIVPLLIGGALGFNTEQMTYLVSIDIFMCGIATLLQLTVNRFFGIGLPVVLGCAVQAIAPIILIGQEMGISAIYGSIIASGLFVLLIAPFFSKIVRFFPPVVTGSVVTVIGLTLIPVAINNLAGGVGASDFGSFYNIGLGFGTLLLIILVYRFGRGFTKAIAVLIGLVGGSVAAAILNGINLAPVREASFFHLPQPFYFGTPTFEWPAIVTMILISLVSMVESTGVYFALSDITGRSLKKQDLTRGYRAEGLAIILGGIFNTFPYTGYSQNVGLVQLSGIKTRKVIYVAAAFLLVLGLVPKIGAVTTIIPTSVLGGAMVAMFGMVVAQGIKMLGKVNFTSQENLLIIACSVGVGLGVTVVPDLFQNFPSFIQLFTSNGIVAGSFTAIILNIIFNMLPSRKKDSSEEMELQQVSE
ncbi:nucleobase:cation symporter-2 family protein [Listeria fleischmannii]|uniref:Purine permease n=1 Tax=Listeria fleischmannii TaxID=1069827 RepID=A0A841YH00_9LIST|nr:nucleobase:cation symporter-2 family protein [Listeria fleischmannii]MBC1399611.1 purine permease [Listeria fleischmannii]MBC1427876.1 purine permease [Listeria fleischmannii]STY35494.1 Putative purine permease ygfU [Listeria fleischmannii subsp. coloradonensis]